MSNAVIRNIATSKLLADNGDAIGVRKYMLALRDIFNADCSKENQRTCGLTMSTCRQVKAITKISTMVFSMQEFLFLPWPLHELALTPPHSVHPRSRLRDNLQQLHLRPLERISKGPLRLQQRRRHRPPARHLLQQRLVQHQLPRFFNLL